MKLLLMLPAASIYDMQHRVMGWRYTPVNRDSLRQVRALVPRLMELSPSRVISSDLDESSARTVGHRLNVPVELWQSLRRFNWGKHHGDDVKRASKCAERLEDQKPEVPIHGGDSRASFSKRILVTRSRLAELSKARSGQTPLVIAAPEVIQGLLNTKSELERHRIYEAELADS